MMPDSKRCWIIILKYLEFVHITDLEEKKSYRLYNY